MKIKIPIVLDNLTQDDVVITEHEFGDPFMLTVLLPQKCNGKVHLPRIYFDEQKIRSFLS